MGIENLFGELPEKWETTTLGNICQRGHGFIQTGPFGSQLHAADYVEVGIPTIMPLNIGDNKVIEKGISRITKQDAERLRKYRLQAGDIVYSRRGDVTRRALIREEQNGWLCGTGSLMVRFGKGIVDPKFVSYFLGDPSTREWIQRHAVGATMPNLNTSIMAAVPFIHPPLSEQRAIAGILGALDEKIELNRRMNSTLESIARAVFRQWFVESEKVEGWEVAKIKDVCEKVENGGTPRRDQPEFWEPATIPWLTSGEVRQDIIISTENKISEEGYKNSSAKMWSKGTTIVALYGATAGEVSFVAHELCANQACCGLVPNNGWQYFVYLMLSAPENTLESQARGSAQQNLSQQIVADFSIRKPDQKLLSDFNQIVAPMFDKWIANLNESRTLASLRDTLLPKLMKGEVRVKL